MPNKSNKINHLHPPPPPPPPRKNTLYFGDCLEVMRKEVPATSVDLIYLDPPFNSKRIYNAFMGQAQWVAFEDTWSWHEAVDDFHEVAEAVELAGVMEGLRRIFGEGGNLAYLSYMANRLRECRHVLKPTGSIYLHCDPTMSHPLKIVMDGIFGRQNFRNEIVWGYEKPRSAKKIWRRNHDVILFYTKTGKYIFYPQRVPTLDGKFEMRKPFKRPDGTIWKPKEPGKQAGSWWYDIPSFATRMSAKERLGYPTQKPLALLERIIRASSNPGDVVLDPFCGCGTTIHAAQNLGRRWMGIDICVNACKVIEKRFRGHFDSRWSDVEFIGFPKTFDDARTLARLDSFRFERWAASLVDGMEPNRKQRGDRGIDGRGRLAIAKGKFIDLVSQVKGGRTNPGDVQAFNGARQQEGAHLGIFTCFGDRVTSRMRDAAASTGSFMGVPAVQIYTVDDYFEGRRPRMPRVA